MDVEIWRTTITFYIATLALQKNEKESPGFKGVEQEVSQECLHILMITSTI